MSEPEPAPGDERTCSVDLTAPSWTADGDTHVRGSAFVDGEHRDAAAVAAAFSGVSTRAAFQETVDGLDGFFAVVHETADSVYAAVDHVQTAPLLYGHDGRRCYVSDDGSWIRSRLGDRDRDPVAETEFLLSGYVTGGETVYPDVRQLQAGELLAAGASAGDEAFQTSRYFRYRPRGDADAGEEELLAELADVTRGAFDRLIEVLDGRTAVVPLSGGYDSRLVALMLDRLGYDDVVAFSWGKSWDSEHKVSRRIAEELGVQWEYVEYTNERWHDWFHSPERERYYDRFWNYDSLPGMTNLAWPAVWELTRSGRIPDDAVVVPGHTVASPSEHLPSDVVEDAQAGEDLLLRHLRGTHFRLWQYEDDFEPVLDDRILRVLRTSEFGEPAEVARAIETFDWQERQAKFINGDLDAYEFFGHDVWMPYWDREYVDFWESLPLSVRRDKHLHAGLVEELYAEHTDVDISEAQETETSSLLRRAHQRLYHSPLFDLVRPIYRRSRYWLDPRGWPGIMPRDQFNELYTGRERVYSVLGLELLGRVSFDPPELRDPPDDGTLPHTEAR